MSSLWLVLIVAFAANDRVYSNSKTSTIELVRSQSDEQSIARRIAAGQELERRGGLDERQLSALRELERRHNDRQRAANKPSNWWKAKAPNYLAAGIIPPIALFIIGWSVGWIARGFK